MLIIAAAPRTSFGDGWTAGLEASWPLDDGGGLAASDSSGHGHAGILSQGPAWASPGFIGTALSFDGVDDHVAIPHAASLNAYPLTVSAWFKTSSTTAVRGIVNKYVASSFSGYQIHINGGRLCAWYIRDAGNHVFDGTGCPFNVAGYNDDQWHQALFTVDASGGRLYVDGVLRGSRAWIGTPGPVTNTQEIRIGRYPGLTSGPGAFQGTIDQVRLYRRALAPAEILDLHGYELAVGGDTTAPAVSLTAPATGSSLAGTVTVSADAFDSVELAGVQFQLDGVSLGPERDVPPYSVSWNTASTSNGPHTLRAIARDAAGNVTISSSVSTTVDNLAPVVAVSTPLHGAVIAGGQVVRATAWDNVGVVGVRFMVDGLNLGSEDTTTSSFSRTWNTLGATGGAHAVTAVARDAAGNLTTSPTVMVIVDNQPPAVALTSPPAGAPVSGTVTVTASASDNVAVAEVQFQVDGASLGADTTAPYAVSWDTTALGTGAHALSALARDSAGNAQLSTAVPVDVSRYSYVTLTNPARVEARDLAGATVATFTVGSYTVATEGPLHTLSEQTTIDPVLRSVSHTTWVRLLPEPFDGSVDAVWLDQALEENDERVPDILEIALQYIETAPALLLDGMQIAGNAHYGPLRPDGTRAEGSDFHDYLGVSWVFSEETGDLTRSADADQLRSLDCSGLARMIFGYRGGIPLSYNVQSGNSMIPRRANEIYESAPGTIIIPHAGAQSTAYDELQPGDAIFWDADADDGPRLDHVGIYLGLDPQGYHRFISSRKSANGPTMGDYTARSVLNRTGIYTTAFRAARRL